MKKEFLLLLCAVTAFADSSSVLSPAKKEILDLKREQILRDQSASQTSWLSPLNLSASLTKNKSANNVDSDTKSAGVSWSQDLFRSGGIYYTVKNANATAQSGLLGIDKEEYTYLKQIYTYKAQIERDRLALEQKKFSLKNYEIDLFIIQAKYKVGSADISELNQAVINKESARDAVVTLQTTLENETYELKKLIGDHNLETIELPTISDITKEDYLANNIELLQYVQNDIVYETSWKNTRSSYLPKLTLNASYAHQEYNSDTTDYTGDPYSYGLTLSMPLDFNSLDTTESKRLQFLQTKSSQNDRMLELQQEYDKYQSNIKNYEEKIKIANEMTKMYTELYDFTKQQVKSGFKSTYDEESLANSLKIQELEKKIQNYNIIIQKISLYFDMRH